MTDHDHQDDLAPATPTAAPTATVAAAAITAPLIAPYLDDRPKDLVADADFADALGLLDAVLDHLDVDAGPAAIELTWAAAELDDYSTLTPTQPVRAHLREHAPRSETDPRHIADHRADPEGGDAVIAAIQTIRAHLQALLNSSADLSETLRYLRCLEHLDAAHALLQPAQPDQTDQRAAPTSERRGTADGARPGAGRGAARGTGRNDGRGDGRGDGGGEGRG